MSVLADYEAFVRVLRTALLWIGVLFAIVCVVDWAVRTRRINPFNRIARFFRGRVEWLMQPVERVIVRAGGSPTTAPWWALIAYAVAGILLINLAQFIGAILLQAAMAVNQPTTIPLLLLSWVFAILRLALLVRVLSSWLPISPTSRWIRWSFVLTEWMIAPLRRVIPALGMIDITPIVAWFLLYLVQRGFGIP